MIDEERRAKLCAGAQARWQRPEEHEAARQRSQRAGQCPELKAKRSENATAQWSDTDRRQQRSEAYKARFADPEFKAAVLAKRRATLTAKRPG